MQNCLNDNNDIYWSLLIVSFRLMLDMSRDCKISQNCASLPSLVLELLEKLHSLLCKISFHLMLSVFAVAMPSNASKRHCHADIQCFVSWDGVCSSFRYWLPSQSLQQTIRMQHRTEFRNCRNRIWTSIFLVFLDRIDGEYLYF